VDVIDTDHLTRREIMFGDVCVCSRKSRGLLFIGEVRRANVGTEGSAIGEYFCSKLSKGVSNPTLFGQKDADLRGSFVQTFYATFHRARQLADGGRVDDFFKNGFHEPSRVTLPGAGSKFPAKLALPIFFQHRQRAV
jgi:hypothetical protein